MPGWESREGRLVPNETAEKKNRGEFMRYEVYLYTMEHVLWYAFFAVRL